MKRILTVVMTLLILISSSNSVFATMSTDNALPKFQSETEFLEKIGVLPDDVKFGNEITRGDFAYMISKLLYYGISYTDIKNEDSFSDIDIGHKYYDEIRLLKNLKIISGYSGNVFYPDDLINYQDATAIILKVLSYERYTEAFGGYPTGYLYLGTQFGLYREIDNLSGYVDWDSAVKLIYNSLFIDTVNIDGISVNGTSLSINAGRNVLSEYLGIRKYDAILINDGISSFNGETVDYDNKVILRDFNTSEDVVLTTNDREIFNLFGQRLTVFVKENENSLDEILVYEVNKNVNITILAGDKIINYTDSYIEYELDKDASKFSKISFDKNYPPIVFINGKKSIDYKSSDFKNNNSRIVFIDNDSDKKTDIVNIFRYDTNIIVDGITSDYITDKSEGGKSLDLSSDKAVYRFIYSDKVKSISDIRLNDVISVAESDLKFSGKNVYYLSVTRGTASGMLEAKNDDELIIDGKTYELTSFVKNKIPSLKFENIKGYLDTFGRITYFEKSSSTKNYAYVLGAAMTGNAIEKDGIVKLFTAEGKAETYTLDDKVTMNEIVLPDGFEIKDLIDKLKETTEDLIVYSLNNEGYIKNISFAMPFDTDEKNNENKFVYVKQSSATAEAYSGYSFGGVSVDGAVCFNISSNFDSSGKGCEIFSLKSNQYYSGVKFYDLKFDGTVGAVLIKGSASSSGFTTTLSDIYIYEKMTDCITENGDMAKKLYYYNRGKRGSIIVSPDAIKVSMNDAYIKHPEYDCDEISDLKFGDIFTFETDLDGYLGKFCKLYEHNPSAQPDEDGRLFMSAAGGTGTAKEIFIVQGTIRYRSADKLVLRLNGDELSLMPFLRSENEYAYKINVGSKKIELIPVDQLEVQNFYNNTSGESIILQASRHKLKEVIIYE